MAAPGRKLRSIAVAYPELLLVLVAAGVGLAVESPLAWLASRQAINVLLAVLVFATAITIEPAALGRLGASWRQLLAAIGLGVIVLPPLAWLVAHLVAAGPLRDGVMTVGLASCEIASVATTVMAGGDAALAAGVLIGSTLATVALAGPILAVEASGAHLHPIGIMVNLAVVVAAPLTAGLIIRARWTGVARLERPANRTAIVVVALLVAVIASEIHLSTRYFTVALALVIFLAVSAVAGRLLGFRSVSSVQRGLLLTTSMRDFAIAADLATAAFGPRAAAPLGVYGVLVLIWGTGAAGVLRQRQRQPAAVLASD